MAAGFIWRKERRRDFSSWTLLRLGSEELIINGEVLEWSYLFLKGFVGVFEDCIILEKVFFFNWFKGLYERN